MRLLLVEDHVELRRMAGAHLRERGFEVDEAGGLEEARASLAAAAYDALVLDLGLPDGEGADLLKSGRGLPPALILTARDQVGDRVSGLNAGADDYLTKPFSLQELEARLRAILRRPGRRQPLVHRLADVRFDTVGHMAFVGERPLRLGRREARLLEALMEAPDRTMVRDHLEERIYGFGTAVTPNALEASASRLRRALDAAGAGVALESRRGLGYRLRVR